MLKEREYIISNLLDSGKSAKEVWSIQYKQLPPESFNFFNTK